MRSGTGTALLAVLVAAACLVGASRAGADGTPPAIAFSAGATQTVTAPGTGQTLTVGLDVALLNADNSGPLTATWATNEGAPQTGTLTFKNDGTDTTQQVKIAVSGTAAETITVTLTGAAVDPAAATAVVTVQAAPNASIANATFAGAPTATAVTLPVTLSSAPSTDVTVHFTAAPGSAKPGPDYSLPTDHITIAKGATSGAIPITLSAATTGGDFAITLSSIDGGAVLGTTGTTATITITPAPIPTLAVRDTTVAANNALDVALSLQVTLSQPAATDVGVDFTTQPGTASFGVDYNVINGRVVIPAGSTSTTIPIRIMAGSAGGTFEVILANPSSNAALDPAHTTATITITPAAQPLPTVSVAPLTLQAAATDKAATIPVTLSGPAPTNVTVDYAVTGGTAIANIDYKIGSPTGKLQIAAGQRTATIALTVLGGSVGGAFTVTLSNPTNATLDPNGTSATITIAPAASGALPKLAVADTTVAAGTADTPGSLPVTLSAAAASNVTVAYAATDGTAKNGTDYVLAAGTLTIPAGQTSASISIVLKANTQGGTFTVTLSSPSANATIDPAATSATVTIVNGAALSVADTSVAENNPSGTAGLTVTLVGAPAGTVTVDYATADGTAQAGKDYVSAQGTLTFAPGEKTKTIAVTIKTDTLTEGSETFTVTLSNARNATLARARATVTITDASGPPVSTGNGGVGFGDQNTSGTGGTGQKPSGTGGTSKTGGTGATGGTGGTGGTGSKSGTGGTAGSGTPSGGTTGSSSTAGAARVTIAQLSQWLTPQHTLRVRIGCPKTASTTCNLTLNVLVTIGGKQQVVGATSMKLRPAASRVVGVRLQAKALSLLARSKILKATLLVKLTQNGKVLRTTRAATIRSGRPPKSSVTLTPRAA